MATLRFNLSSRRSLRKRPAFSLAELMIALVILGLGLLFIAAALPVGVDYTRRTLDLAAAEAAGDEAIQAIQLGVRTAQRAVNAAPGGAVGVTRLDSLVRPRTDDLAKLYPVDPGVEPILKVRPLIGANINLAAGPNRLREVTENGEELVFNAFRPRLQDWGQSPGIPQVVRWNLDRPTAMAGFDLFNSGGTFSAASRVYPAISADTPLSVDAFFQAQYAPRRLTSPDPTNPSAALGASETRKLSNARLVWSALYRRVAYDNDPDGTGTAFPKRIGDPDLYEFIVFVVRRPTPQHRFARQDSSLPDPSVFQTPGAVPTGPNQPELLMPEPWLVAFQTVPLVGPAQIVPQPSPPQADRQLRPEFRHSAELSFGCSEELGKMLPVGSYIVPALNDDFSGNATLGAPALPQPFQRRCGFVPHAPDTLPIYEVVKRPDSRTVVVKGNGYYPWLGNRAQAKDWLCWIIPPPFTERVGNEPVYDQRSQILTVVRRTIRVPEMP